MTRPGTFQKGYKGGPGRPPLTTANFYVEEDLDVPKDLYDMRWAYYNTKSKVKGTAAQEMNRQHARKSWGKFQEQLSKMEREYERKKAGVVSEEVGEVLGPDDGAQRCRELARGVLGKMAESGVTHG